MRNPEKGYELIKYDSDNGVRFIFESIGHKRITKSIEYSYFRNFSGRKVYNLGFGDYNKHTNEIADETNTNNGDAYMVFHTVLNSIPVFFDQFSQSGLFV